MAAAAAVAVAVTAAAAAAGNPSYFGSAIGAGHQPGPDGFWNPGFVFTTPFLMTRYLSAWGSPQHGPEWELQGQPRRLPPIQLQITLLSIDP